MVGKRMSENSDRPFNAGRTTAESDAHATVAQQGQVAASTSPWRLNIRVLPQPTDTSCGPTCLQAVYAYYQDPVSLDQLIREIPSLASGGTLAVLLGNHALRRGYRATLYTFNLRIFDPTWFWPQRKDLGQKLRLAVQRRKGRRRHAARAYLEFAELGGDIRFQNLTSALLRHYLGRGIPILSGLSATFLYRSAREQPDTNAEDDIGGDPVGHFVVLSGYHPGDQLVHVADPYPRNPLSGEQRYDVPIEQLLNAILLGVLTYDGNLLMIQPESKWPQKRSWMEP
jgi:hypothetical protein